MMPSSSCSMRGESSDLQHSGFSPVQNHSSATRRRILIGFVLDTWVWVEYWRGNTAVRPWVEERGPLFSSTITFAETVRYCAIQGIDTAILLHCLDDIRTRSTVLPLDEALAISAGHLKNREVEGIADAIILATARAGGHQVVTGDPHFRDVEDAVYLGEE